MIAEFSLTAAEVGLLRQVQGALTKAGWKFDPDGGAWENADMQAAFCLDHQVSGYPLIQYSTRKHGGWYDFTGRGVQERRPKSVEHGVDELVNLGILPAEIHSAYRAGLVAAYAGGSEEWEVRFTDRHYSDSLPYRRYPQPPVTTEAEARSDLFYARKFGYEGITLRYRRLSKWMDVEL